MILRLRDNAARTSISLDTLPKIFRLCFPSVKLIAHSHPDNYFSLQNGAEIWVGGLDDKDRVEKILGKEYSTIFFNECSQISYSSILTALTRLAQVCPLADGSTLAQRAYYDLNPVGKSHWTSLQFGDKRDPVSRQLLVDPENYQRMFINPIDNQSNLSQDYLRSLANLPERQRKRFYEGIYIDELEGALWSYEGIERGRVEELPVENRRRVVVAIDPSGAASAEDSNRDEIGIAVGALGTDGHGYILADRSLRDSPAAWARVAISAYHDFSADCIVAEQNFGGEMVRSVIKGADPNVPVKLVTASRGKAIRAEPIAALYGEAPEYKNIRVHHVGRFSVLEDQLCAFTTAGYRGEGSPDHADACVWALTELLLGGSAEAWISYFQSLSEESQEDEKPQAEVDSRGKSKKPDMPRNNVVAAYERITQAAMEKKQKCSWCGEELGSSYATDGEDKYHNEHNLDCYRTMLKAGRKVRA